MATDAAPTLDPNRSSTSHHKTEKKKLSMVVIHLDLGIGGAEQLILHLAAASVQEGHDVTIVTSHCSQDHCFAAVKRGSGELAERVKVWGDWLPKQIMGRATALCSTVRLLYLSLWVCLTYRHTVDVVVLDVLPTPLWFLRYYFSLLFYCHFPDKLLTRDTVNGEVIIESGRQRRSWFQSSYREFLDRLEEVSLHYADVLVVNSKFTRETVRRVFSSLTSAELRVLHPAFTETTTPPTLLNPFTATEAPIVSLNRFERKKNIELAIQSYAWLRDTLSSSSKDVRLLPPLVIAGGYDVQNAENVEYRGELQALVQKLDLKPYVTFRTSVSDEERTRLLSTALCVLYTPYKEHFGIVPLEVMYTGRPVIAVNSGGPQETVLDGRTGYLCDNTPPAFGRAMLEIVRHPDRATQMGHQGRTHVQTQFGFTRFQREWNTLVQEAVQRGTFRRQQGQGFRLGNAVGYVFEAAVILLCVWILTWILQTVGVLDKDAQIVGSLQRALWRRGEEL